MWMLSCLLCAFSFPQPTDADRAAIHDILPGLDHVQFVNVGGPWSGVSGPHPGERIQLFTTDFGIARVAPTWHAGTITMQEPGGTIFVIAQRQGVWRIDAIMKQ